MTEPLASRVQIQLQTVKSVLQTGALCVTTAFTKTTERAVIARLRCQLVWSVLGRTHALSAMQNTLSKEDSAKTVLSPSPTVYNVTSPMSVLSASLLSISNLITVALLVQPFLIVLTAVMEKLVPIVLTLTTLTQTTSVQTVELQLQTAQIVTKTVIASNAM